MDPFSSIPANLPCTNVTEDDSKINNESTSTNSNAMSDDDCRPYEPSKKRLEASLLLKAEGTSKFKESKIIEATESYEASLEKVKDDPSDDELKGEFNSLRAAINSNLSLCYIKQSRWIDARRAANTVLGIEENNIKALYRRGYANSRLGFYEEAKDDLTSVYNRENSDADAYRELEIVKKKLAEAKIKEKKSFKGLFDRADGLYDDYEAMIKEQKENERKKKEKEEQEFEQINKEREAKGETVFKSIEEWKQSKQQSEPVSSKPYTSSQPKQNTSSTLDYDEEDRKILEETKKMGYRYFDRPNQDKTAAKPMPRRVDEVEFTQPPVVDQGKALSAWNAAGTYEEKDCTNWFKEELTKALKDIHVETQNYDFEVMDVSQVKGDAQTMVVRGSRRYFYSMDFEIHWKLELDNDTITGTIIFSDVTSTATSRPSNPSSTKGVIMPDWLVDAKLKCDKSLEQSLQNRLAYVYESIKEVIFEKILELENLFQSKL